MGMVKAKLRGLRNYFTLRGTTNRMHQLEMHFKRTLYRWLNRRSERRSFNWKTFAIMWNNFLGVSQYSLANYGVQLSFVNSLT